MAVEGRKQAISIRLNAADLRNLRKLSRRLRVRNSDIIRYAIKTALARLTPLCAADVTGRDLVPVLLDSGADLMRYLDLDEGALEAIVNEGAPLGMQVDRADVQLLAMDGQRSSYARLRLVRNGLRDTPAPAADALAEDTGTHQSLRKYFFDKYVYEQEPTAAIPRQSGGQP